MASVQVPGHQCCSVLLRDRALILPFLFVPRSLKKTENFEIFEKIL
jgi:hypothetical protein